MPAQSSTFTGTIDTPFATPHVVPPIVPATWVPWPWQSFAPVPSPKSTANDDVTRPANWVCVMRNPVSMT